MSRRKSRLRLNYSELVLLALTGPTGRSIRSPGRELCTLQSSKSLLGRRRTHTGAHVANKREPLLTPWLRNMRLDIAAPYLHGTVLDMGFGSGMLASRVSPERYYGYDIDPSAPEGARQRFPKHTFSNALPEGRQFDLIVSLAVIEHTPDPTAYLATCGRFLAEGGRIVLTTPNPALEWLHGLAAAIGLLSHEAHEDHQSVVGREALVAAARSAGLKVDTFRYFMLGANQALVLSRS